MEEIIIDIKELEEITISDDSEVIIIGNEPEDLTKELTEQNNLLGTQKTIIEEILEALGIGNIEDGVLTTEQIEALNNAIISIENGELIFDYDDEVLKLDFNIENKNLMVNNNLTGTDFNINQNGELEVSY